MVDGCENVYLSGWGGNVNVRAGYPSSGTDGLTVTLNAIKSTTDNSDFYFFVLEKDAASQLYGSFFGQDGGFGEHIDGGSSRFTKQGMLAICANCGRDVVFPTTPGVWSTTNGFAECNLAAIKINFDICNAALPVHLAVFEGRVINSFHELSWQVVNEQAGYSYIVEQSAAPSAAFTKAYTSFATSDKTSSSHTIKLPAPDNPETFYRLKMISVSGKITYSNLVLLTKNNANIFKAFVLQDNLYVRYPSSAKEVALYSIDGKLLHKQNLKSNNTLIIPLSNLLHGTLVVKVRSEENELVSKVVY